MGLWGWWIDTGWHNVQINPNLRPGGLGEAKGLKEAIPCQVVMRRLKLGRGGGGGSGRMRMGQGVARVDRAEETQVEWSTLISLLPARHVRIEIKTKNPKWLTKNGTRGGWGVGVIPPAGMVTAAAGWLDGWCMVTVAHALVHGIRGTVSNLLFRLYVGQEWLSPATLRMGGVQEEQEVDWHYIAALRSLNQLLFCLPISAMSLCLYLHEVTGPSPNCKIRQCACRKRNVGKKKTIFVVFICLLQKHLFGTWKWCRTSSTSVIVHHIWTPVEHFNGKVTTQNWTNWVLPCYLPNPAEVQGSNSLFHFVKGQTSKRDPMQHSSEGCESQQFTQSIFFCTCAALKHTAPSTVQTPFKYRNYKHCLHHEHFIAN